VLAPSLTAAIRDRGPDTSPELAGVPDALTQLGQVEADLRARSRDDGDWLAWLYARFYLADGVLQKVDRASMLHALEVRAPLLDPEVVDLARRLPTRLKLRGLTTKWLLRRLARRLLPRDIADRPKKGFGIPLAAWLRGPLRDFAGDHLSAAALRGSPFLAGPVVGGLLDDHLAGRADHRKLLWALLSFVVWERRLATRTT
jgi:asparagine synthase (glutamine-hydrolysing)